MISPAEDAIIRECVESDVGQRFSGADFRALCGPQVYLYVFKGQPLYIGMTGDGLARSGSRNHKQARQARRQCDEVFIWPTVSRKAALKLEALLIAKLKPTFNRRLANSRVANMLGVTRQRVYRIASELQAAKPLAQDVFAFAKAGI